MSDAPNYRPPNAGSATYPLTVRQRYRTDGRRRTRVRVGR
jgi:hypothetical protein